jgi:hypothetical protein
MATVVFMPRLTDTMHQGKILEWLKREGESVQEGDPLFVQLFHFQEHVHNTMYPFGNTLYGRFQSIIPII